MPFSPEERARIRAHLGYLNVQPGAAIQFGMPRPIQTLFLVEEALQHILPEGEERVRYIIRVMDRIECLLVEAQDRLAAIRLGELELRENEPRQLEEEYVRWGYRLADQLGVPIYAYSIRYREYGSTRIAGNVPVYS